VKLLLICWNLECSRYAPSLSYTKRFSSQFPPRSLFLFSLSYFRPGIIACILLGSFNFLKEASFPPGCIHPIKKLPLLNQEASSLRSVSLTRKLKLSYHQEASLPREVSLQVLVNVFASGKPNNQVIIKVNEISWHKILQNFRTTNIKNFPVQ
jgi:hypothetical protein